MFEEILGLVWAILVVVVVLALAYGCTRLLAGRLSGGQGRGGFRRRQITVLEQVTVGKDQKLLLVKVGEKCYLLGAAQGGITRLDEVPPEVAERWEQERSQTAQSDLTASFQSALRKKMERWKNGGGS